MLKDKLFDYYRDILYHKYRYIETAGVSFSLFCLLYWGINRSRIDAFSQYGHCLLLWGPIVGHSLHVLKMYLAFGCKLEISRIRSYKVVGAYSAD